MANEQPQIILYHYIHSPYARRVVWYLTLRNIPYIQCIQPHMLPRPDLSQLLGVKYRRIPLMAIGRDVYLDTRLILQKLERLYPASEAHPALAAAESPEQQAMARLLSHSIIVGKIFESAAFSMPTNLPMLRDPAFVKDRADMSGAPANRPSPFSSEVVRSQRPEALVVVRDAMALLEDTLLADGRDWVLNTSSPSLADIEAVWVFHWLNQLPGALPEGVASRDVFPRVFAFIDRFTATFKAKLKQSGGPKSMKGPEAAELVTKSPYAEPEGSVDAKDPVGAAHGLKKGDTVTVYPTDSGMLHKDAGKLIALTNVEIVIEVSGPAGSVRVHAPRQGFKVRKAAEKSSQL